MLKEDIKDHGYVGDHLTTLKILMLTSDQIFRISIYFAREDTSKDENHGSEGVNKRVFYHKGHIRLKSLLDSLMVDRCDNDSKDKESDQMNKERGKMLVTNKLEAGITDQDTDCSSLCR